MINLIVIKSENFQNISLTYHFYDDINRIPLEIILDESAGYREGINVNNYDENTRQFITFKFDKDTKILCNITFVSINEENIIYEEFINNINIAEGQYLFYINDFNTRTNYETKLMFDSKSNSLLIYFNNIEPNNLNFYFVDKNLLLGLDTYNNLNAILLKNLDLDDIKLFLNL